MAAATLAAQADVGAEAIDEPGVATARMAASEPDDVAQEQRRGRAGLASARQGIKAGAAHAPGRGSGWSPAARSRSTGVDRDADIGLGRGQLGDDAAGSGQAAGQLSGLPIAPISKRVASGPSPIEAAPAGAGHDVPGHDPDVVDGDRLRAGVAQLVEQLLDGRRRRSGR